VAANGGIKGVLILQGGKDVILVGRDRRKRVSMTGVPLDGEDN